MKITTTALQDVLLLEPVVHEDERGHFFESFNARGFEQATGLHPRFVQDNQSHSRHNVLRGLHYQIRQPQGKLVRVIFGEVFDVTVDLRESSPTFGQWAGFRLSAQNRQMLWIPPGFAHGFLVLSKFADCLYKATDYYAPQHERCLRWDDPTIGIEWPLDGPPLISGRDLAGMPFTGAEHFP